MVSPCFYLWTRKGKTSFELHALAPWFGLQPASDPEAAKEQEREGTTAAKAAEWAMGNTELLQGNGDPRVYFVEQHPILGIYDYPAR